MTIEISTGGISAGCAALVIAGKITHWLVAAALQSRDEAIGSLKTELVEAQDAGEHDVRDLREAHDRDVAALKSTQKLLFEKLDGQAKQLSDYKTHVAETYVNQAALEKLLAPIERRLETIEKELRHGHG